MTNTTIDIDVGGTFTDVFVNRDGETRTGKALTTYEDLSIGVVKAIEDAAGKYGLSLEELLEETNVIRYSTTILINSLIQRKGRRLGLITTQGLEHLIYIGRSRQWGDGLPRIEKRKTGKAVSPKPLIGWDDVAGVAERTDALGKVIIRPRKEEVVAAAKRLIEGGVKAIVVSFLWSFLNPSNELYVKEVLEEAFKEVREGIIPVYLSSQVQPKWFEYPRTMTTIIEAYLHDRFVEDITKLTEGLKRNGYRNPLMIVHGTGGMASPSKTRVVDTYNAGPIAGTLGCLFLGNNYYDMKNIITTEMGGTSFNMSIIYDGKVASYEFEPIVDRWPINVTFIENRSIGAGGGSIAWFNEAMGGRLEVGPWSAGSNPGPVCYGLGGKEPTVTDANVVLGYYNPDYFLGGRMKLDKESAISVIRDKVADRLGVDVEEAALAIKKVVENNMGGEIYTDVYLKGFDPREFTMFNWGGAGPAHAIGINSLLKCSRIVIPSFSGVFDAFAASTLGFKHIYEKTLGITAYNPLYSIEDFYQTYVERFNETVKEMVETAVKDIASEGVEVKDIALTLELDMRYETQTMTTKIPSPVTLINSPEDAKKIIANFKDAYYKICKVEFPEAVIRIETARLIAEAPFMTKPTLKAYKLESENPEKALKGKRDVFWEETSGYISTPIYDLNKLRPGNVVEGPAVIEAETTTVVVNPGWKCAIDKYYNLVLNQTV
jgi:N-methylhydantoinase A/acetophenone carboxylase